MTVHRNVPLLAGAQALYWCGQVIAIIVAALVGQMLAPHRLLATLPLACITLGNIAVTRTLSRIMQQRGRRAGFTLGSLAGLIGGALNVAAIVGAGASFAAGSLLHLVGWTAVNVGILPLIVVAGLMNLALMRRQRSPALPAPA
jgi:hypothetical protein